MHEIHFNRLTFPSFTFYRWTAAHLAKESGHKGSGHLTADLEPETAAGLALRRLLGDACPRSLHIEAEDAISAYGWGSGLESFESALSAQIPGATVASRRLSPEHLTGSLRFRLRCTPTLRRGGREIDAWVAHREAPGSRLDAYRAWLAPRLKGARIDDLAIAKAGPAEIRLPAGAPFAKPSAILEGQITTSDPISLMATLARGVGRHGRLGFGTLILGRG